MLSARMCFEFLHLKNKLHIVCSLHHQRGKVGWGSRTEQLWQAQQGGKESKSKDKMMGERVSARMFFFHLKNN